MSPYEKLDALIVVRLKIRPATFAELLSGESRIECERIVGQTGGDAFRVLDRRLQALRKRGVIFFDRAVGWRIK